MNTTVLAEIPDDVLDLMDNIYAESLAEYRQKDEFNVADIMERKKLGHKQAYDKLNAMVRAGRLTKRRGRDGGRGNHPCDWYKMA